MNDWEQELYEYALRKEGKSGLRRFGKEFMPMMVSSSPFFVGWTEDPAAPTRFKWMLQNLHKQGQSIDSIRAAVFLFFG